MSVIRASANNRKIPPAPPFQNGPAALGSVLRNEKTKSTPYSPVNQNEAMLHFGEEKTRSDAKFSPAEAETE